MVTLLLPVVAMGMARNGGCRWRTYHRGWAGVAEAEGFEPPVPLGTLAFKLFARPFTQGPEFADVRVTCGLSHERNISCAPEPG